MNKDKSFNTRNMLVLVFEVLLIVIAIGGLTFATSSLLGAGTGSTTIISFGEFDVDYLGETEISFSNLEPVSDSLINYNTTENVMRLEFSIRGAQTNQEPEKLIYDIVATNMNIDCSLLNKYTKWNLYKNGELIYNGNFAPEYDGNVLTDNFRFTETQQRLPLAEDEYDNYVLLIWISESCDDLATCEWVDQSNIVNSNIDMKVFIAVSSGDQVLYERVPNKNAVCVNKPEIHSGMLPVYYDEGFWKIADKVNWDKNHIWYDYGNKKWANVVIVNSEKYKDSKVGTVVLEEDILDYYVWIPRFKYKVWNDGSVVDSYNALNKGIDIVYESGVNSTGDIKCINEDCNIKVNKYLTHPAFSDNLRGLWVRKYEMQEDKTFTEYNSIINNLSSSYNINAESHMISNLEWGATLYLSHSKYGICNGFKCLRDIDSTTNNNSGVYGIYGGKSEYTVGSVGVGSAIDEMNLYNYIKNNDYVIRGKNSNNIVSRSVLVNKKN